MRHLAMWLLTSALCQVWSAAAYAADMLTTPVVGSLSLPNLINIAGFLLTLGAIWESFKRLRHDVSVHAQKLDAVDQRFSKMDRDVVEVQTELRLLRGGRNG